MKTGNEAISGFNYLKSNQMRVSSGQSPSKSLATRRPIAYIPGIMNNPFGHEFWMRQAIVEAQKAYRLGEVPVGAIIIHNAQIIGRGFNQTVKLKDPTAHAEILAISAACEVIGDWRLENTVMYCTLEPCSMCAGAAVLARIGQIIFGASDPKFGACGSIFNIPVEPRLNHRIVVTGGIMADEIAEMMKSFFAEIRNLKGGVN